MVDFFHDDCVITDITVNPNSSAGTTVSCKINGRFVKKMVMEKAMQRYLKENAPGEKHRVWFTVLNIFGKRIIMIRAVENESGGQYIEDLKIGILNVVFSSFGLGFLIWLVSYVLYGAVHLFMFEVDFEKLSIWTGVLSGLGVALWSFSLKFNSRESQLPLWPAGEISRFTKAVKPPKPAFKSDFSTKK